MRTPSSSVSFRLLAGVIFVAFVPLGLARAAAWAGDTPPGPTDPPVTTVAGAGTPLDPAEPPTTAVGGGSPLDPSGPTTTATGGATPLDPSGPTTTATGGATPLDPSGPTTTATGGPTPLDPSGPTTTARGGITPLDPSGPTTTARAGITPLDPSGPTTTARGGITPVDPPSDPGDPVAATTTTVVFAPAVGDTPRIDRPNAVDPTSLALALTGVGAYWPLLLVVGVALVAAGVVAVRFGRRPPVGR